MPLGEVRSAAVTVHSDYEAPAKVIADMINDKIKVRADLKKHGKTPEPLRIVVEAKGTVGLDPKNNPVLSAYGPVGASLFTRILLDLGKSLNIPIEVSQVTDNASKPVLQAINKALDVPDVTVDEFPLAPDSTWLEDQKPDVYLAVGPSPVTVQAAAASGGTAVPTLLPDANDLAGTTTFAIADGTNLKELEMAQTADHSMTAWNLNLGAEALAGTILKMRGALGAMHTPSQVRDAYDAAADAGAKPDDSRFETGAAPFTLSAAAHAGSSHLLQVALDTVPEARAATWRDDLAVASGIHAQQGGTTLTLADYNQLFERAAPGGLRDRLALGTYELFFRTRMSERLAITTGAAVAGASTLAMASGMITPLDAAALAALGTTPRQYQIVKMTSIKRGRTFFDKPAGDDATSQLNERRRTLKSDLIRFVTYPVTGSSIVYDLLTHPTFGSGAAGTVRGLADSAFAGAVVVIGWVYGSKLFSGRVGSDGVYRASLRWEPTKGMSRSLDYAAYPLFTFGSALNLDYASKEGLLHWDGPSISAGIRAGSNGGQTLGVISERIAKNISKGNDPSRFDASARWLQNSKRLYPAYDWVVTTAGSLAVIANGVVSIYQAIHDENKRKKP
jgi:hypothetical protein